MNAPILRPYQQRWIADRSRFRLWVKARRIGGTFAVALGDAAAAAGVDLALGEPCQPTDQHIFSASQEGSKRLLEQCAVHLQALGAAAAVGQLMEDQGALRLRLTNGRSLYAHANNAATVRGAEGDVTWDEAGATPRARELYQAVKPLTDPTIKRPHGYRLNVVGTALDDGSLFRELCETEKGDSFSRHRTSIHEAIAEGFPGDAEQLRAEVADEDVFGAEYLLIFMSSAGRYISAELLDRNVVDVIPAGVLGNTGFAGYDVARRNHKSSCAELVRDADGRLWLFKLRAERALTWDEQERIAHEAMERCARMSVDATGIGSQFAERLQNHFGSRINAVTFTAPLKEELVTGLKLSLERGMLRVPADPDLRRAVLSIRRRITPSANVVYETPESGKFGHGDEAWALALAVHAAGGAVTNVTGVPRALAPQRINPATGFSRSSGPFDRPGRSVTVSHYFGTSRTRGKT